MKKLSLYKLRTRAPKIPEYSCPVIDEIIADLSTDPNMTAKKFTNVKRKLNRLRKQNTQLRSSGVYWYEIVKKILEKTVKKKYNQ
jgi:hypothetical protein|tara:strand:+ start:344 stop:598 length:255 start_codon:yes stop_codon:yes gene_type:complete